MSRLLLLIPIACLALAFAQDGRIAADDDTVVAGKKTSEWLDLLEKGEKLNQRRAAILALGIAGPKTPGVVGGLSRAMRKDKDVEVRREAAQALRNMAAEAADAMELLAEALKEEKDDTIRMVAAA